MNTQPTVQSPAPAKPTVTPPALPPKPQATSQPSTNQPQLSLDKPVLPPLPNQTVIPMMQSSGPATADKDLKLLFQYRWGIFICCVLDLIFNSWHMRLESVFIGLGVLYCIFLHYALLIAFMVHRLIATVNICKLFAAGYKTAYVVFLIIENILASVYTLPVLFQALKVNKKHNPKELMKMTEKCN